MLQSSLVAGVFALLALVCFPQVGRSAGQPLSESQKIESLIRHVEQLKNARFVRNGREYDAATAGKFLRGKWDANKRQVATARDFIAKIASKSSTSGRPYLVRFADGREVRSGDYLTAQLQRLETPPTP